MPSELGSRARGHLHLWLPETGTGSEEGAVRRAASPCPVLAPGGPQVYHSNLALAINPTVFYKLQSGHSPMQVNQWKRVTVHVLGPGLPAR